MEETANRLTFAPSDADELPAQFLDVLPQTDRPATLEHSASGGLQHGLGDEPVLDGQRVREDFLHQ